MPYVDNGNGWSWCAEDAHRAIRAICRSPDSVGLIYRVESDVDTSMAAIGFIFDAGRRLITNKPSRVWRLSLGSRALAHLGRCTRKVVQVTAGLSVHGLGLRRCALSVLQAVFRFSGDDNEQVLPFGDEVRDELLVAAYLLPLVFMDMSRPLADHIFMSGSSL